MGEYDVEITNKNNGSKTTVTVKTANSAKAAENVSVAATAVSAVENNAEDPRNKGTPTLTKNNVLGTSSKPPGVTRKTQKALNAMRKKEAPSEPASSTNTPAAKPKTRWEQVANRVAARKAAEAAAASGAPTTGGKRRSTKRKSKAPTPKTRKQRK